MPDKRNYIARWRARRDELQRLRERVAHQRNHLHALNRLTDDLRQVINRKHAELSIVRGDRDALREKYRTLRQHVRKDGKVKVAQPKDVAIQAAERMSVKHGEEFTAYPCSLCNGMWHVGRLRSEWGSDHAA